MPRRSKGPGDPPTYKVGRGKPPVHSRFKPGQSGNPAGRQKGSRNLSTDVKIILAMPVRVKEDGRTHIMSTQAAALKVLREKVLRGDARAIDSFLALALRFNNDPGQTESSQRVTATEQAILDAYVAKRTMSGKTTPPTAPNKSNSKPRLRSWRSKTK